MDIKKAKNIVGNLSKTSKMPCHSWGIPASYCDRGSELRKVEGSVCSKCYACKGMYQFKGVREAGLERYTGMNRPEWREAMVEMIKHHTTFAVPYFRWFDSGDLQSEKHLEDIVWIAEQLPQIKFWLPTHELKLVRGKTFPDNLTVRVSAAMIDGEPPNFPLTSTVVREGYTCNAHDQGNKCLDCRKCWSKEVKNVAYKLH